MESNDLNQQSRAGSRIVGASIDADKVPSPSIKGRKGSMDADEFSEVFVGERKRLVRRVGSCRYGWMDREDVVQQAALELWHQNRQRSIQTKDHLRALLRTRVKSRAADCRRRVWGEICEPLEGLEENEFQEDSSMSRHNLLIEGGEDLSLRYDMRRAIASLPSETQQVITACYIEGYTQHQASQVCALSRDQVARRLKAGKDHLSDRLSSYRAGLKNRTTPHKAGTVKG
jgi:RNA polymerase sigma factor (sigma-70 family)